MPTLHICLFGKFRVSCGDQLIKGLDARKVQELFCYLLLHPNHPHPREMLASLLWEECSTAQSKTYLRKVLWQLQTPLAHQHANIDQSLLLADPEWIQLNLSANLWLDVSAFEQRFELVRGIPGERLDKQSFQLLRHAVALYQGDLLEGWYHDWCLYERERLRGMYLAMLDKLMGGCEVYQEYETGLMYAGQILRHDRAREQTHRRMMRLYFRAGDRTAALRQYEHCRVALDEELDVTPTDATTALYEQIRANRLDDSLPATSETKLVPESSEPLTTVLDHLKQFRVALADMQWQVQQHIQTIEQALHNKR